MSTSSRIPRTEQKNNGHHFCDVRYFGAPEGIRTPDLLIRSQTLYPAELRAHIDFVNDHYYTHNNINCQAKVSKILKIVFLELLRNVDDLQTVLSGIRHRVGSTACLFSDIRYADTAFFH